MSTERLLDHRKAGKAAWEQFAAAHDDLVGVLPEEEAMNVEEFGALNNRWRDQMGDLADKIRYKSDQKLQQDKQAEEQRVQQEGQAELERQHQLELDQVMVRRLRLANRYAQTQEHLTRLLGELTLDKPPSAEELVVDEHVLIMLGLP